MILKNIFKLMTNAIFVKTMENVRKDRGIKLITTERGRNKFSYYKVCHRNFISKKMRKKLKCL